MSENSISVKKEGADAFKKEAPLLGIAAIIFLICAAFYFLLGWKHLPISSIYIPLAQKIVLAVMLISLVLLATRLLKKIVNRKIEDKTIVFNFIRIANLFAGLFILTIVLSLMFDNWYATMVSLGIVSLILGFALQNPITSFFWMAVHSYP